MIGAEDFGQSSGKLENPIPLRVTKVGMSVCVLRSVADAKLRPKKINLAFTSADTIPEGQKVLYHDGRVAL